MTDVWIVVAVVGVGTMAIKAAGPVLLGGRSLPERFTSVIELLGPALLGALVAWQTFGNGEALAIDERVIGVGVAAIAIWRRAPLLLVVVLAAVATGLARALL